MSLSSRRNKMLEIFHLSELANLRSHSDCEGNDYESSPHNSPHELPPELRAEKPPEFRRPLLLVTRIVESPTHNSGHEEERSSKFRRLFGPQFGRQLMGRVVWAALIVITFAI